MNFAQLTTAAVLAVGLLGMVPPAFATDTSTAVKLCAKNPNCHSRVGEHSVIMAIDGKDVVECPNDPKGVCIMVRTIPLARGSAVNMTQSFASL